MKPIKNYLARHGALIGVMGVVIVLSSLGTTSATHYANAAHKSQPAPAPPKQITLIDQGKKIIVTPAELGWSAEKVNQAALTKKVTGIADATQQAPVDAKIITQNGDYVISPSVLGQRVDVAKSVKMIKSGLFAQKGTVTLPVTQIVPAITEASLQPQLAQMKAQRAAAIAAAAKPVTPHSCADNPAGRQLILVSISQQHLWACNGTSQAYDTAITSGAYLAGDATPTGTWHIYSKQTDVHLTGPGYDDFVNYWMPFYSDYGFHDSPWQTFPYGSSQYASDGSHGCVHLPAAAMAWLYSWAPIGTTVTITG